MKKLFLAATAVVAMAFSTFAQLTATDTRGISIQGIARDAVGSIYASKTVTATLTVLDGSTQVYQEKQAGLTTDIGGVFSTNIGAAPAGVTTTITPSLKFATFSTVDFNSGSLAIKVDISVNGGTEVTVGTFALQSVPYAKLASMATNAKYAENANAAKYAENATHATAATKADNGVPIGTILPFAGPLSSLPAGYAFCDGAVVTIGEYEALFNVINYSWGWAPANQFHLPDLRGLFLRGWGRDGQTYDTDAASRTAFYDGGAKGNTVGTFQENAIASHKHIDGFAGANGSATWGVAPTAQVPYVGNINAQNGMEYTNHAYTSSTGGSETRPKNASVLYIIKCK